MDWIEDAPFLIRLIFTLPVLNAISWGLWRLYESFDYGEWYEKLLSPIAFLLGLTPLALIDTIWLIFVDHDEAIWF